MKCALFVLLFSSTAFADRIFCSAAVKGVPRFVYLTPAMRTDLNASAVGDRMVRIVARAGMDLFTPKCVSSADFSDVDSVRDHLIEELQHRGIEISFLPAFLDQ